MAHDGLKIHHQSPSEFKPGSLRAQRNYKRVIETYRRSLNDLLHDASGRSSPLTETHRCYKKLQDMSASIIF
eukprot:12288285-Karenia_brevis.AAC.1